MVQIVKSRTCNLQEPLMDSNFHTPLGVVLNVEYLSRNPNQSYRFASLHWKSKVCDNPMLDTLLHMVSKKFVWKKKKNVKKQKVKMAMNKLQEKRESSDKWILVYS